MYYLVLIAHSWWRWVVLAAGAAAVGTSLRGLTHAVPWADSAARYGRLFGIAVDIQFLMGASLYLVFSPVTTAAVNLAPSLPAGSDLRFFAVFHGIAMALAWIFVHLAAVIVRRGRSDPSKHRRGLIFYGQTLVIVAVAIPWWRPLLRV